jgi:serine kinase of HPr protein (carbohydrate metabolism regulator)
VRVNRADGLELVRAHLPPGWRVAASPVVEKLFSVVIGGASASGRTRRFNLLYEDHVRMARTTDLGVVCETLESRMRAYVAERARRRVFVHAGAVGWRGRAIIIPGRSFSGKSSLVAELVRAGATYYSDEFAVLDESGRVHPYAKPLSLRAEGEVRQEHFGVEELGGTAGVGPLPVGLVLVTEYEPGARWQPRRLTQGQGALALLSHVVAARRRPARSLAALERVVATAPVLKGRRGDASEITGRILSLIEGKKKIYSAVNRC